VLPSTYMYFSVHYVYYMVYEIPKYILGIYLVAENISYFATHRENNVKNYI